MIVSGEMQECTEVWPENEMFTIKSEPKFQSLAMHSD